MPGGVAVGTRGARSQFEHRLGSGEGRAAGRRTAIDRYARFKGIGGCADELRLVIAALWLPVVKDSLLEMIEQAPALQLFDSGQESHVKRHLSNLRTFLVESEVVMVGDLCKPGSSGCP